MKQLSRVRDWRHLSSNSALRKELIGQLSKVRKTNKKWKKPPFSIIRHNSNPFTRTTKWISRCSTTQWTNICDIQEAYTMISAAGVKCGIFVTALFEEEKTIIEDLSATVDNGVVSWFGQNGWWSQDLHSELCHKYRSFHHVLVLIVGLQGTEGRQQ